MSDTFYPARAGVAAFVARAGHAGSVEHTPLDTPGWGIRRIGYWYALPLVNGDATGFTASPAVSGLFRARTRAHIRKERWTRWAHARWAAEQPLWERDAAYGLARRLTEGHYERLGSAYLEALSAEDLAEAWVCEHCPAGADHVARETTTVMVDGGTEEWCTACVDDGARECGRRRCTATVDDDATVEVDGCQWCPDCAETHASVCQHCDAYTEEARQVTTSRGREQSWCESCAEYDAVQCSGCRGYFEEIGEYCDGCEPEEDGDEDEEGGGVIRAYHHHARKARPIDSPWVRAQPKPLYLGVECEVECPKGRTSRVEYAQRVCNSATEVLLGIEEDGSLQHGFEIITHPAGLDKHRAFWPALAVKGLKAHDTDTCGLHIHLSRDALRPLTIGRMQVFLHDPANKAFVEGVCRRSFNRYALSIKAKLTDHCGRSDRYEALNLTNSKTVELRLPRGSIQPSTILGTLEFCYALVRFCEQASNADLTASSFLAFITTDAMLADTRALRTYLVTRSLAPQEAMKLPKPKTEKAA